MILPHLKEKPTEKDQEGDNQFSWGNKIMKICLSRIRQGCLWFWRDFKKPHLLWVKLIFMLQSASLVTLYPYLIVHLRSLGFTIEDASIVNTAVPLADVIAPPAAGFLADKIGNFRVFMSVLTFLNGVSSLFLLTVNHIETSSKVSNFSVMCCTVPQRENMALCYFENNHNFSISQRDFTDSSNETVEGYFKCLDRNGSFEAQLLPSWNISHQNDCFSTSCSNLPLNSTSNMTKNSSNWLLPTFWHYLGVRVLLDIFRASSLMLFEGALVAIIKEQGGDYGLQKLFGTLGGVIFGPLSGQLIDLHQKYGDLSAPGGAYMPVILLYFILRTITAVCLLKVNLDFKPPAKKVVKNVWQVMKKFEVLAFLGAFLVSGILWGFLENFLFWLLEDLGSTKFLMGISLAVGTLAGLPLTLFSSLLIKKLGFRNIMTISMFLYAIRLMGYSLSTTPEWILLFEALKPFCTTLLLIAVFMFIKNNSTLSAAATVESIFGSSYFGIGRGIGGLVGGFSIENIGIVRTFRLVAIGATVTAVIYGTLTEVRRRWGSGKYPLVREPTSATQPSCAIISFTRDEEKGDKEINWVQPSPNGDSSSVNIN